AFPQGKRDEDIVDDLAQMRDGVQRAIETDDRAMLEQLDCFFEERMGDGWGALRPTGVPTGPRRAVPGLGVLVPAPAVGLGLLFGRAFWSVREDRSDRAGLRAAAAAGNYALIDAYLDGGGRLADEGDTARFQATRDDAHPDQTRRRLEHYLHQGR